MSIPFLTFTCDSCDYYSSSLVTFGEFLWNYDGQTFNFDRQLGLCQDCKEIVAMEKLPDPDVMDRARKIHATYTGPRLFLFQEKDEARCLASQEGFNVLDRVMELRRPPVCLKCGGNDVQPLVLPEVPDGAKLTDMTLTNLELKHPGCAGQLQVEGSGGLRLGLNPVTYYFGIDGKAFATLQDSPSPREEKLPPPPRLTTKLPTRSQDWRPDWGTFVKRGKAVEITFEDPELDVLSEVDVVEEWEGGFRIYGYACSDVLYWGDLFEGEFDGRNSIHFKRLLDRPEYHHFSGGLPPLGASVPHTQREWTNKFPYLKRAIQAGGYWEFHALFGLYVVIPKNCLSDFPEFEGQTADILNEPPDDVEILKPHPVSHEGRISIRGLNSYGSSIDAEKDRKRRIRKLINKMPD